MDCFVCEFCDLLNKGPLKGYIRAFLIFLFENWCGIAIFAPPQPVETEFLLPYISRKANHRDGNFDEPKL